MSVASFCNPHSREMLSQNSWSKVTPMSKCLHGETQNFNESFNNVIWVRCPKRVYVGNSTFKTTVASTVTLFNDGAKGLLPVFDRLGIEPGYYTMEGYARANLERIKQSDRKSTDGVKARRQTLRSIRKGFTDKDEVDDGKTLASGLF